jgi:hypothetical protein
MPNYKPLGLEDKIPFGQYKDYEVQEAIAENPGYVQWLVEVAGVALNREAEIELKLEDNDPMGNGPMRDMDNHWG